MTALVSSLRATLVNHWWWALLGLSFAAYCAIFLPLISADATGMGHDYSSALPMLLAGYYWFLGNGPFATPWFTPAQCGGVPYFPNFIGAWFSVPQWLTFAVGPLAAVRATFVLFAGAGALGFFLLLRRRFAAGPASAIVAAILFLFNGTYAYRMDVGQLGIHPFALTPWLAWAVLAPAPMAPGRLESILAAAWPPAAGGLVLASMLHTGMIQIMPPLCIAVAVMLLVHGEMHGHRWRPWLLFAGAFVVFCALSASKIVAVLSFLGNFPRTFYSLPGFPDPWYLLRTLAAALFWRVSPEDAMDQMTGVTVLLELHEWEYGLGPAALALLVSWAVLALVRAVRGPKPPRQRAPSIIALAAIAAALALPIALNWYDPVWNGVLKSTPVIGSTSNLVRWFTLYVPLGALLAGLALQHIAPGHRSALVGAILVAGVTIAWNAAAGKDYYTAQPYNGKEIEDAWRYARAAGRPPPISRIVAGSEGPRIFDPASRNNALVREQSQLLCYEPVFGYRLETFPAAPLQPGPALKEFVPGLLNVKNPACYVFPRENGCRPGAHFGVDRRADAERFLRYEPFPFVRSRLQTIADGATMFAIVLLASVIVGNAVVARRPRHPHVGRVPESTRHA